MSCIKFIKSGGGRGRPPYGARCSGCGVIYTDHANPTRDRYKKALQYEGVRGVTAVTPTISPPPSIGQPGQNIIPVKG